MRINPVTGEFELGVLGNLGIGIGFGMMAGYGPIYSFFGLILPLLSGFLTLEFIQSGEWGISIAIAWFITGILLSIRLLFSTRYNIIGRGFFWWIIWSIGIYVYRNFISVSNYIFSTSTTPWFQYTMAPSSGEIIGGILFWVILGLWIWDKNRLSYYTGFILSLSTSSLFSIKDDIACLS